LNVTLVADSSATLGRLFPNFIALAPPDCICRSMTIQRTKIARIGMYERRMPHQFRPEGFELTVTAGSLARIARPRSLSSAGR
jgi:hypothetical protein